MPDYWERKANLIRRGGRAAGACLSAGDDVRLASLVPESVVDGPGLRFVVFAQGCPHRCPGCHNPDTHLTVGGTLVSVRDIFSRYRERPASRGITLSGGEPFLQAGPLAALAGLVREDGGDVITYTGFVLEALRSRPESAVAGLLEATDLLIDGPFVLARRSLDLPFIGSSNQRLIALTEKGNDLLSSLPAETKNAVYFSAAAGRRRA